MRVQFKVTSARINVGSLNMMAKLLWSACADLKTDKMRLVLPETVKRGMLRTVAKLIEAGNYIDIDEVDEDNLGSGLFHCCCGGHFDLACLFLKHGAESNFINKFGSTPLHAAADNDHLDLVRLLLHHAADPNAQNFNGDTPCHLAASRGNYNVVEQLLKGNCNVNITNDKQKTCLAEAAGRGHTQVVKLLSEYSGRKCETKETSARLKKERIIAETPVSPLVPEATSRPISNSVCGVRLHSRSLADRPERCPTCYQSVPPARYYDVMTSSRAKCNDTSISRPSARSSRYFEIDEQNSWEYVYVSPTEKRVNSLPSHGSVDYDSDDDTRLVTK